MIKAAALIIVSMTNVRQALEVHMNGFLQWYFIIVKINIKESYITRIKKISPFSFKDSYTL